MQYQTINPFTEELIKTFPQHTDAQLQEIITKAEAVYENDWSGRTLEQRKTVIKNAATILREMRDEFTRPITGDGQTLPGGAGGRRSQRGHTGLLCR